MPTNESLSPVGGRSDGVDNIRHAARRTWSTVILLVSFAVAIGVLRWRTFDEPLDSDIVTYMLVGDAIDRGGWAYTDGFEIKPPGAYAVYALAELAAGMGERQRFLLNILVAGATLVGVYAAAAALGRRAGLWGALFWILLSGAPSLEANQPNTEAFINACVVWALALLARASSRPAGMIEACDSDRQQLDHVPREPRQRPAMTIAGGSMRPEGTYRAVAVGILFAVATTFKQIAIVDAALLSAAHLMTSRELPGGYRRGLRDVAIFAAVGAVCWVSLIVYFAATGRFDLFWVTNFRNAQAYVGNPLFNLYLYVRFNHFLPSILWFAVPVMCLVLVGCLRDRRTLMRRPWALYLAGLAAIQIKIPVNGTVFLHHYYQYWLPLLAIGAGWTCGVGTLSTRSWNRLFSGRQVAALGVAVAGYLVWEQGRYLLLSADELSRLKFDSRMVEGRDLGPAIGRLLRPEETLYQHGDRPELYFYSQHRPPSLLLWTWHLDDTWPVAPLLLERHLAALDRQPPDFVVVETAARPRPRKSSTTQIQKPRGRISRFLIGAKRSDEGRNVECVLQSLLPKLRPVRVEALRRFTKFEFYVRRGTPLDRRLADLER